MRHAIVIAGLLASIPALSLFGVLSLAPSTVFAQEEDDTPEGAQRGRISGRVRDQLSSPTDIDFFGFTLRPDRDNPDNDTSGNITVHFSQEAPPGANPQSGWIIELFSEQDLANSLYTTTLPETSLSTRFEQGLSPGEGRRGTIYYFKISSLDKTVFPDVEYTMSTSWEENTHYEKPPNDIPDDATPILPNQTYFGNLSDSEDIDFFRFSLEAPDVVTLVFEQNPPGGDPDVGWTFSLLGHQEQRVEIPSTNTTATLQASLDVGVHYLRVAPMVLTQEVKQGDEVTEQEVKRAPKGRKYQITANVPSAPPPPTECPKVSVYGQHPQTQRWVAFPTPCEVPPGWFNTRTPPSEDEVCPSPHATYLYEPDVNGVNQAGRLTIPLVDLLDGNRNPLFTYRVELQEVVGSAPPTFQLLPEAVRLLETHTPE